ncbi:MAG TPA: efflux RND transporter periplasmic adaptor subunit [Roseimicrobium sp.]|nr:efflux RND transporter periplasmic adaptor subunit [Roseimicrobium sp.]
MIIFKRLSFYIALVGLIGGGYLINKQRIKPPTPPPLAEPTRSPYTNFVAASGIIEARRENVSIATPRQGLITKVYVQVGETVKQDAPLLQLDDREAKAKIDTIAAQIQGLEAQRNIERVAVADWTDRLERSAKLLKDKVASEDEHKRLWFNLESSKARLLRYESDIRAAAAQLKEAETQLSVLTVKAPRDGKILQVNVRAGEYAFLSASSVMMILGDVNTLQIRADVDEQDAPLVVAGQNGTAYLKGGNDKKMPLRFTRIEPFVVPKKSLTGDSAERVDTRVLQIIFEMDTPPFPIYVGQQVDVFIERPANAPNPKK